MTVFSLEIRKSGKINNTGPQVLTDKTKQVATIPFIPYMKLQVPSILKEFFQSLLRAHSHQLHSFQPPHQACNITSITPYTSRRLFPPMHYILATIICFFHMIYIGQQVSITCCTKKQEVAPDFPPGAPRNLFSSTDFLITII